MKKKILPEERLDRLGRLRRLKMARSAHAFVRGNTAQFYTWLGEAAFRELIPEGPPIWICGDCHLGNLGPVADADGSVDIQIRDLDHSVIGNPAHDLIRLGVSLASAARGSDLPGVTTAHMVEAMMTGYAAALSDPDEEEVREPNVVRAVKRRALGRKWRHLARERLEDVDLKLPLGRKFWPLRPAESKAIRRLFAQPDVRATILQLNERGDDGEIEVLDAAYWRKGCSSLGCTRYAVLLAVRAPECGKVYALADLKEAVAAVAPAAAGARMPRDAAQRVVAGARALSPNLGHRMLAVRLGRHSMVLRELLPQDLKIEVDQFSRSEAVKAAHYLANVVGRAHARQLDAAGRAAWRATLHACPDARVEAPSWLWRAVVELLARHEKAYLEHCRMYALSEAGG